MPRYYAVFIGEFNTTFCGPWDANTPKDIPSEILEDMRTGLSCNMDTKYVSILELEEDQQYVKIHVSNNNIVYNTENCEAVAFFRELDDFNKWLD